MRNPDSQKLAVRSKQSRKIGLASILWRKPFVMVALENFLLVEMLVD